MSRRGPIPPAAARGVLPPGRLLPRSPRPARPAPRRPRPHGTRTQAERRADASGTDMLRFAALVALLLLAASLPSLGGRSSAVRVSGSPARTVFVSSTTGSDSNSGENETAALASVQKAVAGLRPGDTMLLRRGDAWTVETRLEINGTDSHVSWAAGVTIAAFGPAAERPLLTGTAATAATVGSELLRCVDVQAMHISGISFALTENALNLVFTEPGVQYSNVTIDDCHFRDIAWANFSHRATGFEGDITYIYGGGNAVRLVNSGRESCLPPEHPCDPPTLHGLVIKNNLFERVDMAFTSREARVGLAEGARMGVSTVGTLLDGNLFTQCSFNIVMIDAAVGFTLQHNVFLRNTPVGLEWGSRPVPLGRPRLFGYGTTDLIIGFADASTAVRNNDFIQRGEYTGGPDGCAIDLETACHNLSIGPGNTFFHNVGASVNVFGHAGLTSQNFTLTGNVIIQNGCQQGKPPYFAGDPGGGAPSSDVGAVSFDLAGGSGRISNNSIVRCADETVPLWGGPPSHQENWSLDLNTVRSATDEMRTIVAQPTVLHDTRTKQWPNLIATTSTPGAVLHYTLDGSRPTEASPLWPPTPSTAGPYALRTTPVLVRAFKTGMLPSASEGVVRYV